MILSLLYPNLKYAQNGFHQDHVHPFAGFYDAKLKALGLSEAERFDWQQKRNKLPNLQLLEGRENVSKNDKPLVDWLKDESNKTAAKFLPMGVSYELQRFDSFYQERQKLMSTELKMILA